MPLDLYLAYIAAVLVLMLIPGPNVALICANSIARGARYGLITVAGTSSAVVVQLTLTLIGMTALLSTVGALFEVLRWAGVIYLIWLGIQAFRAPAVDLEAEPGPVRSPRAVFMRGFLVCMTNPKTLLFYGAFLPQFVSDRSPALPQLILLAVTFLAVAIVTDSAWALTAARFRRVLAANGKLRNRLTGTLLIGAALGLSAARKA